MSYKNKSLGPVCRYFRRRTLVVDDADGIFQSLPKMKDCWLSSNLEMDFHCRCDVLMKGQKKVVFVWFLFSFFNQPQKITHSTRGVFSWRRTKKCKPCHLSSRPSSTKEAEEAESSLFTSTLRFLVSLSCFIWSSQLPQVLMKARPN